MSPLILPIQIVIIQKKITNLIWNSFLHFTSVCLQDDQNMYLYNNSCMFFSSTYHEENVLIHLMLIAGWGLAKSCQKLHLLEEARGWVKPDPLLLPGPPIEWSTPKHLRRPRWTPNTFELVFLFLFAWPRLKLSCMSSINSLRTKVSVLHSQKIMQNVCVKFSIDCLTCSSQICFIPF